MPHSRTLLPLFQELANRNSLRMKAIQPVILHPSLAHRMHLPEQVAEMTVEPL